MATHNFQIFDESLTAIDTDQEYLAESQRINGVTPGLAAPKLHNKLYRQCSVMAYAIASVLAQRGYDATDSDPGGLINAIQRSFAGSVNGNRPNASGAVSMSTPLDAWPVGSIFMTMSSANPATLLGGGTWVKLQGQYLLASSSAYTAGQTYGSMTKTLTEANIPGHTHGFTTGSAGAHTHSLSNSTAASAGAHTHSGTAASAGGHTHNVSGTGAEAGAHTHSITANSNGAHTHSLSNSTAASAGAHTHSITANSNGAHTHSVSGTSGGAGSHSHTRGSMNITGDFSGVGQKYGDLPPTVNGAFYVKNTADEPPQGVYVSNGGEIDDWIGFDASRPGAWTGSTSSAPNHTHSFSATSTENGAHTHSGTAASNGAHTHTVSGTAASAGAHTHTGSAASNGAHTHTVSGTAASAGAHTHSVSTVSAGAHTHTVSGTAASAGSHTHSGTTGSTGSGTAFNVQPLSIAVNVWRRTA
jgi:hypothetical protein